jgi:adenylate cyclase
MAVFNFPIRQDDHAAQAVRAARQMQQRWRDRRPDLVEGLDVDEESLSIGIGISSGDVSFGEFGQTHRDLTAIGTVVNASKRRASLEKDDAQADPTTLSGKADMAG